MCRQIKRFHTMCGHNQDFVIIECDRYVHKKQKGPRKMGFWNRLFGSDETSCKIALLRDTRNSHCPFCSKAANLVCENDRYGMDLAPDDAANVPPKGKFKEELGISSSSSRALTFPETATNLRHDGLMTSTFHWHNHPEEHLPPIRSKTVDPGIDLERWSHVRDHFIPPMTSNPPNIPLPPTPLERLECQPVNVPKNQASASQGRQRDATRQGVPGKPIPGQGIEGGGRRYGQQTDGPSGSISLPISLRPRRRGSPLPLMVDKDREVPEMAFLPEPETMSPITPSFLYDKEFSIQDPLTPRKHIRRSGGGTNRPREKPVKFRSLPSSPVSPVSPVSPPIQDPNSSRTHYVDRPNRRAHAVSGGHENIRSVYGNLSYISPRLGERIDEVERLWTSDTGLSEDRIDMPRRAETDLVLQKGKGKSKTERKVRFDETERDNTR